MRYWIGVKQDLSVCRSPADLFPYHDIELDQNVRLTEEEKVQHRQPSSVCVCHIALKNNLYENDKRELGGVLRHYTSDGCLTCSALTCCSLIYLILKSDILLWALLNKQSEIKSLPFCSLGAELGFYSGGGDRWHCNVVKSWNLEKLRLMCEHKLKHSQESWKKCFIITLIALPVLLSTISDIWSFRPVWLELIKISEYLVHLQVLSPSQL